MKILVILLVALAAGAQAVQPENGKVRNKSLNELKETLENIRANLMSMKPTINVVAGLVDSYSASSSDTPQSVNEAFVQLNEKNIPSNCMQEATAKLNEIKAVVDPNCTVVRVVEDVAAMSYSTISFAAVSMVTLDDVLNGLQQCSPWWKFWHFVPCVFTYAWSSYQDLSKIITAAVTTWKDNEAHAEDIAFQVFCKIPPFRKDMSQLTTQQVLNEAYLCSKKSF